MALESKPKESEDRGNLTLDKGKCMDDYVYNFFPRALPSVCSTGWLELKDKFAVLLAGDKIEWRFELLERLEIGAG